MEFASGLTSWTRSSSRAKMQISEIRFKDESFPFFVLDEWNFSQLRQKVGSKAFPHHSVEFLFADFCAKTIS